LLVVTVALVGALAPHTSPAGADATRLLLVLERISIAILLMIFGLAWTMRRERGVIPVRILAAPFLAAALFHAGHAFTFAGRATLVGTPDLEVATDFWLLGRTASVGVFLYLAFARPDRRRRAETWRGVACVGAAAMLAWVVVNHHREWLPRTIADQAGPTPFGTAYEYALAALAVIAAVGLYWRARRTCPRACGAMMWLAFAAWAYALAELCFTVLLAGPGAVGHLVKLAGDLAIYRALFVAQVREPHRLLRETERKLAATLRAIPDPWVALDAELRVTDQRSVAPHAFGSTRQLVGMAPEAFLSTGAATAFRGVAEATLTDGEPRRALVVDDEERAYDVRTVRVEVGPESAPRCLAVVADVTDRRRDEADLRVAASAFEVPLGLVVADARGAVVRVNGAFRALSGYRTGELVGRPVTSLAGDGAEASQWALAFEEAARCRTWEGERAVRRRSGSAFPARLSVTAVCDHAGDVTHFVTAVIDMSAQRESEAAIHRLAYFDSLTGLANRAHLRDQLQRTLHERRRDTAWGALLFIDLDHFKTLNDTQGHDVGDRLLVEVGRRLEAATRAEDVVARLGGDEFVVLIRHLADDEQTAAAQARQIGMKLHRALTAPFHLSDVGREAPATPYHSTPSIGVSLFGADTLSVDEVIKRADVAMYQAKDAGRSTLRFFDPELQASLVSFAALAGDLRGALERGELWLAWQPQVDAGGRLRGVEGLLRWEHPARGSVPPSEFIPVAEETGMIVPIGTWVLRQACELAKRWASRPETREVEVSVNVSARQLHEPDFVPTLERLLAASGAPSNRLTLELTESTVMHDLDRLVERLRYMCGLGVRFAMDDFGTGYSSLALLKRLPLAQVKIDRAFVASLPGDEDDRAIVEAILAMARSLALEVVAEGVETAEQVAFLAQRACGLYQGYRFGRPVPLAELEGSLGVFTTADVEGFATSEYPALGWEQRSDA